MSKSESISDSTDDGNGGIVACSIVVTPWYTSLVIVCPNVVTITNTVEIDGQVLKTHHYFYHLSVLVFDHYFVGGSLKL